MGEVLFEPVFDKEALHVVEIDLADVVKGKPSLFLNTNNNPVLGKFDLDTVGHYSRPDVFQLLVNKSTSK
jgi:nitrilase